MARRVLVISESFGLGHERAAQALIKGLAMVDPAAEAVHTNSIQRNYPRMTKYFLGMYLRLINSYPQLWHRIYQEGRSRRENEGSKQIIYRLLAGGLRRSIKEYRPHAIVCTHPFPAAVITRFKKQGLDVPLAGIITDYDVHAYWLDKKIDLYIVGDRKLERDFASFGFEPKAVSGSGIPIDPVFAQKADKEQTRAKLGLAAKAPVVLVAGGGWGLGDLGRITRLLAETSKGMQIVVVTGANAGLEKALRLSHTGSDRVRIAGMVDNIHDYMAAADVMVTKPGGLTTSEGLAAGLPMVLFDVLYGQETWNAGFLTGHGAAVKCAGIEGIPLKVWQILANVKESNRLRECALSLGKSGSAVEAADKVLKLA